MAQIGSLRLRILRYMASLTKQASNAEKDKKTSNYFFRWLHYLNPNVKGGDFSKEEEELILNSHKKNGNKWVDIAQELNGRYHCQIKL